MAYGPPGDAARPLQPPSDGGEEAMGLPRTKILPRHSWGGLDPRGQGLGWRQFLITGRVCRGRFPARRQPEDRYLVEWARTLSPVTVVQDEGFVRRFPWLKCSTVDMPYISPFPALRGRPMVPKRAGRKGMWTARV